MIVQFLAHAGFYVEEQVDGVTSSLVIDPWFFSSTFEEPILHGVMPGQRTIDFQNSHVRNNIAEFRPDAVLVSHFHTHHSPLREIQTLIRQSKSDEVAFGVPVISDASAQSMLGNLNSASLGKKVRLERLLSPSRSFEVGCLKVTALMNPMRSHASWLIESDFGAFLHIADAAISRLPLERRMDPLWEMYRGLSPNLLAITASAHQTKREVQGVRWIMENSSLAPVEAARVAQIIEPEKAMVIGGFQKSIWTDQRELSLSSHASEHDFRWALDYLAPSAACISLRPGERLELGSRNVRREKAKLGIVAAEFADEFRQPLSR